MRYHKNYVYIGRPSEYGNPFRVKIFGRTQAVDKYELYLRNNPRLLSKLKELKGCVLGCVCVPLSCHGQIIIKLINELL